MKKLLTLIFFISFVSTYGQSLQYFNKLISPDSSSNHLDNICHYDLGYVVSSSWRDTPYFYNQSPLLFKINIQGDILDKRLYLDTTHWYYFYPGNSMVIASDSTIIMAGCRWNLQKGSHAFLMRVDTNLDTLFTKEFTHPDTIAAGQPGAYTHNQFTSIRETYDKGFILTGKYNYQCNTNGIEKPYLLKLDSLCNVEWIRKFNQPGRTFDIEFTPDSGFFFVYVSNQIEVTKADRWGNTEWNIAVNGNSNPSVPVDIEIYDNNTLYISSAYWYGLKDKRGITITKIDIPSRTIVWERNYIMFNNFSCATIHQTMGLDIAHDGNLIISGTVEMPDPQNPGMLAFKGFIAKIDPNGDSLWARHFGYGDFQYINQVNDIVLTDDGGFLTVGFFRDWHPGIMYQDAWIVKMDSLGCDTPGCHLISIEERVLSREEPEVFPNPFGDLINIVLPEGFLGGKLVMYDVQGRRAVEVEVPASYAQQRFTVQTGHLKPGMYLVELTGQNGRVWRRKVVKSN